MIEGIKKERMYFVYKLIPPRASFPSDITKDESAVMDRHDAYWKDIAERGMAIVFGPVLDPKGVYGIGIIAVDSQEEAKLLIAGDPAVKSGLGKAEIYQMARATLGRW